jgi:ketosteroid isomerase-like protein
MAMASSEERERIARVGFEAFNAGDQAALLALFAGDVEVFASPELPNAGRFHGHEGYVRWIEPWAEAWEGLEMEITGMTPLGERHVVAEIHQTGRGREGIEVSMNVAFLFEIQDGLVSYLGLLPTAEQAIGLAGERESS